MSRISRRTLITAGVTGSAGVSGLALATRLAEQYGLVPPDHGGLYGAGQTLTFAAHRWLAGASLAREFSRNDISKAPFANGRPPKDEAFRLSEASGFADWRLAVDGMVAQPRSFSLDQLKALPSRSQITHLACEEGWSFIAEWTGVPLIDVLNSAGILPDGRYVVLHSFQRRRWESLDIADALHPQTLVTHGMNGGALPVGHGGPIRIRVPRQLGYKSLKYLTRLTVTDSLKGFGKGLGSAASEAGYSWYAGI